MKQITAPFPLFVDRAGDPLDAGYVYIGVVNQNPETSPAAVYWDEAGTQPAAQPLRTSAGRIVNGVTPARVYATANDYSMTVKDKNGIVVSTLGAVEGLSVFSSFVGDLANASDPAKGADLVGFKNRTVYDKLSEYVSVKDFGAVGNGVTDDTAAFNLAVQSGSGVVVVPPGNYRINPRHMLYNDGSYSQATRVGVSIPSNVTLVMYGATLTSVNTNNDSYSLLASYRSSNVHIKGGKLIGDRASNTSDPAIPNDFGFGIDFRDVTDCSVEDVESNDMWGDSFYVGVTDTAGTGSKRVTYRNIKGSGSRRQGLSITGGEQIVVDGWNFRNIRGAALGPCAGIDIEPNTTDLVNDVIITNGYVENCNRSVQVFKCVNLLIDDLQVENCDVLFPMLSDRVYDAVIKNVIGRGGADTDYGILWQNSLTIQNVRISDFSLSDAALYAVFMNDTAGNPFSDVVFANGVIYVKDAPVITSSVVCQNYGAVTFEGVRFIIPSGFSAGDTVNLTDGNRIFDGDNTVFQDCSVVNRGSATLTFDCGVLGNRGNTFENINPNRDTVVLQNGWSTAVDHETPFFVKARDGIVTIYGTISGGTATNGTLLFTLPAGFRPAANVYCPIVDRDGSNNVTGKAVTVQPNGEVRLAAAVQNNRVGLSGVTFVARV